MTLLEITTLDTLSFILGAILLAVGLFGGGIEVKEIKIPKVTRLVRILSACIGLVFILLGLCIAGIIPWGKGPITFTTDIKNEVSESNENNNQKTDEVRVKAPDVFSHGTIVIRGTWSCDLDLGKETQTDADFFWQQKTKTIRFVVPRNGARFYVLGRRDFDSIDYNDLTRLRYSSAEINCSNNASNQIPQGTVVAAITSKGRYCKFRIDTYGYNLGISWVTYSKAG